MTPGRWWVLGLPVFHTFVVRRPWKMDVTLLKFGSLGPVQLQVVPAVSLR